jgi:predicted DNA-binding transcriptional regulator YafY
MYDSTIEVYRVSRVQDTRIMDDPSARPEGFDLADYWRASAERYEASRLRCLVTMRVAPAIRAQVCGEQRCMTVEQVDPPDAEGWTRACIRFETEDSALWYLLYYGAQIEILEPHSLRQRIVECAQDVIALYNREMMPTMM